MTYTTDSQLKALNIASGKKEQYIKDGSTKNLFILLRETNKTFIFRHEINGSCKKNYIRLISVYIISRSKTKG
jgi:hypothetical protein